LKKVVGVFVRFRAITEQPLWIFQYINHWAAISRTGQLTQPTIS
jgi:hypothetical protein